MSKINVKGVEINIFHQDDKDYVSLTDMLKAKEGQFFIDSWLRNRNTVEFLSVWEQLYNSNFNYVEFDVIKSKSGLNSFKISVKEWVEKTNAIGIMAKTGRYGGTYAHKDIAFEFGMWISPEFKLLLIKEYQKLKDKESKFLGGEWDYRRFLSKVNYRIQTDAIKDKLSTFPKYKHITKEEAAYIYAHEAEMLNIAVFGITSKQWREENVKQALDGLNIRDVANIPQLTVLANLENYNSILISENKPKEERLNKLKEAATAQLKSLLNYNYTYNIESPHNNKYQPMSSFNKNLKIALNYSAKKDK